MAISEHLAALMREATNKKSQRKIAYEVGISQTTIGNMVMGQIPSRDICTRVAPAIGISENEILVAAGYEQTEAPIEERLKADITEFVVARRGGKRTPESDADAERIYLKILADEAMEHINGEPEL